MVLLGCLIYFSQMAYNQLANAVIFILILNTITRDSFSAGTDFLLNHYVLIQIEKYRFV